MYRHSLFGTFFGSLFVSVFLALIGTEPIVVVTGLYASTLFFNRLFETDVPLLTITKGTHSSGSPPEDSGRFDCDIVETQAINIENEGDKTGDDIEVRFQSFSIHGYPLVPSDNINDDDDLSIKPQDEENELTLSLAEQGRLSDSYYLVVRVTPKGYFGLLDTTNIFHIEDGES